MEEKRKRRIRESKQEDGKASKKKDCKTTQLRVLDERTMDRETGKERKRY